MNGKLNVKTSELNTAATKVGSIVKTLEGSKADAQELSGMIPVKDLRRVAVDFANKWEISRGELVEDLKTVQQQLKTIAEGFEDTDEELARVTIEQRKGASATQPK